MRVAPILVLAFVGVAQAQTRAPAAPAAPGRPGTIDLNRNTAWRDLERTWNELRASPAASDFARGASRVCVKAFEWRDGEPRRTGLMNQSCQGALNATVSQHEVADQSVQTWQRGFVPGSEHGSLDCLALEQLAPMAGDLIKDAALMQRFQDAHQRCGSQQREAQRGREALGLPLCERIGALSSLLEDQGKLDWGARQLAQADDEDALQSRWARLAGRQARFPHVVAYHLSEARIELATFAEHAARAPAVADADEVREAFQCLGEFRAAHQRLRDFERRLQEQHGAWMPAQEGVCCKQCSRGKACGDTCIARDKICRHEPGCACDG
ncbi:MAG TPA: hypothetical protein VFX59_15155 [Polyangiales bacterium]|nr:hypothetical protein [Polyangiales bacterium]